MFASESAGALSLVTIDCGDRFPVDFQAPTRIERKWRALSNYDCGDRFPVEFQAQDLVRLCFP